MFIAWSGRGTSGSRLPNQVSRNLPGRFWADLTRHALFMAKNILVINVDIRETRVALIEDGIIAELHLERESQTGTVGNIYLGKVSRVLPGMQAAFIDIGIERAAFLHVEDLIRPDDFDAYLAGQRQEEDRAFSPSAADAAGQGDEAATSEEGTPEATASETAESEAAAPEAAESEAAAPEAAESEAAAPEAAESTTKKAPRTRTRRSRGGRSRASKAVEPTAPENDADEVLVSAESNLVTSEDVSSDDTFAAIPDDVVETGDEPEPPDSFEPEPPDSFEPEPPDSFEPVAAGEQEPDEIVAAPADAATEDLADEGEAPAPRPPRRRRRSRRTTSSADAAATTEATDGVAVETPSDAIPDDEPTDAIPEGEGAELEGEASPGAARPRQRATRARRSTRRSGDTKDRGALTNADPAITESSADQGRSRGRRSSKQSDRSDRGRGRRSTSGGRGGSSGGRGGRSQRNDPLRLSKDTPIREVVREGQEVVVQVTKEPIGTKGARVSSHISLPGRYVVYAPTVEQIGISKRIGSDRERARLREAIEAMKPPSGGLIVRTLAEGLTKKGLKSDVGYLVRLWGEICKKKEQREKAPTCLYTELDLILKTARDLFTEDIEKIVIDNREEYIRLRRFVEMFMPERADAIELYEDEEPIFDAYGIEDEIGRALSRKVPLDSGGHLVIDQAEALTAIDVNTGRYVGKGSKDLEDTILTTNLEAVSEIAYQLRFRNIGGLIILDLIDMDRSSSREKVRRRLEQLLGRDKAKTTLNRISDLGLIEMTRKRTRESLGRIMHEPCFYCDGTGQLQSKQTVGYEILRQIRRERMNLRGYVVVVNAHPSVVDLLKNEERGAVLEAERLYERRIELVPRKEYHMEQFDLQGK